MRICFSVGSLNGGGIGQNAINLSHDLLLKGVEVDFFVFNNEPIERDFNIPAGARLFHGKGGALKSVLSLRRYLKQESPDVVFSARPYVNVTNALAKILSRSKCKLVSSYRTHHSSQEMTDSLFQKIAEKLDMFIAKYIASGRIAVSEGVAEDIEKRYGLKKNSIKVIYNPAWSSIQEKKLLEPVSSSAFSTDKVIVSVGRLTKQKNIPLLLDAFKIVTASLTDVKLLIIGDGGLKNELKMYSKTLGIDKYVEFLGYLDNPLPYLAKADLFVLSSDWEGFANVIVESLGAGTPVVSTDCPSGPSEILAGGKYGALVEVGNINQLSEAIIKSLTAESEPKVLQKRAEEFSSDKCTQKLMDFLYRLD